MAKAYEILRRLKAEGLVRLIRAGRYLEQGQRVDLALINTKLSRSQWVEELALSCANGGVRERPAPQIVMY